MAQPVFMSTGHSNGRSKDTDVSMGTSNTPYPPFLQAKEEREGRVYIKHDGGDPGVLLIGFCGPTTFPHPMSISWIFRSSDVVKAYDGKQTSNAQTAYPLINLPRSIPIPFPSLASFSLRRAY